jgi:hypothetical protein
VRSEIQQRIRPVIPKTWDDAAIAALEVPLADPAGSPKHITSDYYYKMPVRPIYKEYPIYEPDREPPGYMDWLKGQEPVILWDDKGHRPQLVTREDWIKAGEMVFEASAQTNGVMNVGQTTSPEWWAKIAARTAKDGTLPGYHYMISEKGKVELGDLSCASCHSRVMPDGTVLKGAQGNFPFDHNRSLELRAAREDEPTRKFAGPIALSLFVVPWLKDDVHLRLAQMPSEKIAAVHDAIPPGVMARHRASPLYPVQIPDLIGVKDRRYLDRTGLQQHRSIIDLMRYAALNQARASTDSSPLIFPTLRRSAILPARDSSFKDAIAMSSFTLWRFIFIRFNRRRTRTNLTLQQHTGRRSFVAKGAPAAILHRFTPTTS